MLDKTNIFAIFYINVTTSYLSENPLGYFSKQTSAQNIAGHRKGGDTGYN